MPVIEKSTFVTPFGFANCHLQTIYPTLIRQVRNVRYRRERILTPDNDFLDVDLSETGSQKLVIISHGLEGNSHRSYVKGMVRCLNKHGCDALAWNFRGCSGEMNRKPQFYHSGATYDLDRVLQYALTLEKYESIFMVGFSMGGNITLKYIADYADTLPENLKAAVAFSVPCDLTGTAVQLSEVAGGLYLKRFLKMLKEKVRLKHALMPDKISIDGLDKITTFEGFDNAYTAPLHEFNDAFDYWKKASCKPVLSKIKIPALLINAKDDPFLTPDCFPYKEASESTFLTLEVPEKGGHVGFMQFGKDGCYWSEQRVVEYLQSF